ncbi:hypothetical protein niasHT_016983 [Heterodera trifolii]|uniref:Protein kinase domain-containing protein n=1 Tax=Heterodera trifolii TaxID=157864 RepID=A0ABD2LBZ4_9BILA
MTSHFLVGAAAFGAGIYYAKTYMEKAKSEDDKEAPKKEEPLPSRSVPPPYCCCCLCEVRSHILYIFHVISDLPNVIKICPGFEIGRNGCRIRGQEFGISNHFNRSLYSHLPFFPPLLRLQPISSAQQRGRMTDALVELSPGALVSGRWTVIKKLGAGAFGAVYLCQDQDGITKGALKTEPINAPFPLLALEATVLRSFDTLRASSGKHFCRCMDLGRDQQPDPASGRTLEFNFIVMSLVGRPFDKLLQESGDCFSPGTAIGAALQLLKALQALHDVGYLHRDIKPANLAIGLPETNEQRLLYLLDFGMARKYDGTIRRQRTSANFRGTPIYAPISAHIKRDYSRGDDIESWFYVLIKFYKGAVPWKFIKDINEIGQYKCRRLKDEPAKVRKEALEELTGGCPPEFNKILAHIDGLEPEDRPDYEMIEKTLRGCLKKLEIREHPYDWEVGRQ